MKKQNLKIDKKQEKQAGITLVALVITVVVMLILAGVAIAAVVDGDGLFSKTRQAAETYENAADKEGDMLKNLMEQVDHYIQDNGNGDVVDPGDDEEEPVEDNPVVKPPAILGTVVTENQTYDGRLEGSFDNPIIPKGFAPVENAQDSTITADAVWGSADGYQKGLVIQDEIGNQFVWIPVDGTTVKFERQDWRNSEGELITSPENTTIGTNADTQYTETVPSEITESVITNGGFYIARYEAGIATNMPQEELSSDSSAIYGNGTYKPVSKRGAIVWNYIQWGDTNDDTISGNGVVTVARSMYPVENENCGVVSTLIYGVQWDTTLKFIGAYGGDAIYATDSTGKGNYSGSGQTCGYLDLYRQKNIYDMAGNVYEWTMEKYSASRVIRAGHYNVSGLESPATDRNYHSVAYDNSVLRFPRCTLYKIILNFKERKIN